MAVQTLPAIRQNKTARLAAFLYGSVCYVMSVVTLLYLCGFVGDFGVPRSIDSAPTISWHNALLVDVALLGIFSFQHSVMARPSFKNWWTQLVPKPVERSTYLLFTNLCLGALFYFWQPIGGTLWHVTNTTGVAILYALFASGCSCCWWQHSTSITSICLVCAKSGSICEVKNILRSILRTLVFTSMCGIPFMLVCF